MALDVSDLMVNHGQMEFAHGNKYVCSLEGEDQTEEKRLIVLDAASVFPWEDIQTSKQPIDVFDALQA